jgi:hypothetical protein
MTQLAQLLIGPFDWADTHEHLTNRWFPTSVSGSALQIAPPYISREISKDPHEPWSVISVTNFPFT